MMLVLAKCFFWVPIALTVYTYLIYPLILAMMMIIVPKRKKERPAESADAEGLPAVSMVIAAYNEEKIIEAKLHNCMALNYPPHKLEILIGSDGSTDRTDAIIEQFRRRTAIPFAFRFMKLSRGGKTAVLNKLVPEARGEILVFSDANSLYEPDSIIHTVKHFFDVGVGCVCGELKLGVSGVDHRNQEQNYWSYETLLKKMESRFRAVVGCNGGIYAIRKTLFQPLPDNTLVDDFLISMRIGMAGFDCIYEPRAFACEETAPNTRDEFQRRIRIGSGNIQNLIRLKDIFLFKRGKLGFFYLSHKVLRWMVPLFLVLMLMSNMMLLYEAEYYGFFWIQVLFYGMAGMGYALEKKGVKWSIFNIPYVFSGMNMALLIGMIRFCRGIRHGTWERTER